MTNIAKNIKIARKRKGLTMQELADRLGLALGTVAKWESGERVPADSNKVKVAHELDESITKLFYTEDENL